MPRSDGEKQERKKYGTVMAIHRDDGSRQDGPDVPEEMPDPLPKPMAETKTTYPVNEVLGFGSKVKAMLTKYQTQMIAAKIDPTDLIARLGPANQTLAQENDKQEGMKTTLREQTKTVEGLNTAHYRDGSNGCDMVITAFGRQSEEAQEAVNLRKGVRPVTRKSKDDPAPAAQTK